MKKYVAIDKYEINKKSKTRKEQKNEK